MKDIWDHDKRILLIVESILLSAQHYYPVRKKEEIVWESYANTTNNDAMYQHVEEVMLSAQNDGPHQNRLLCCCLSNTGYNRINRAFST